MNLNDSLSQQEAMRTLADEGGRMFGAHDGMSADERDECARRWSEALLIIAPIDEYLEPAGVFEEGGEVGFFYDDPTPGTPNAARILRWMQAAHKQLKAQFLN